MLRYGWPDYIYYINNHPIVLFSAILYISPDIFFSDEAYDNCVDSYHPNWSQWTRTNRYVCVNKMKPIFFKVIHVMWILLFCRKMDNGLKYEIDFVCLTFDSLTTNVSLKPLLVVFLQWISFQQRRYAICITPTRAQLLQAATSRTSGLWLPRYLFEWVYRNQRLLLWQQNTGCKLVLLWR